MEEGTRRRKSNFDVGPEELGLPPVPVYAPQPGAGPLILPHGGPPVQIRSLIDQVGLESMTAQYHGPSRVTTVTVRAGTVSVCRLNGIVSSGRLRETLPTSRGELHHHETPTPPPTTTTTRRGARQSR